MLLKCKIHRIAVRHILLSSFFFCRQLAKYCSPESCREVMCLLTLCALGLQSDAGAGVWLGLPPKIAVPCEQPQIWASEKKYKSFCLGDSMSYKVVLCILLWLNIFRRRNFFYWYCPAKYLGIYKIFSKKIVFQHELVGLMFLMK